MPAQLGGEDRDRILALAKSIPALWQAPGTTSADRKQIIRCLVDQVIVHVNHDSEYVDVTIHWQGGFTSQHEIVRPVASFAQLRDYDRLLERIEQLYHEGHTGAVIAAQLNEEGFVPPRRKGVYTENTVRSLMLQRGWVGERSQARTLGPDEWRVGELARELAIRPQKVYYWVKHGWVHSRRAPSKHVVIWADRAELNRLRELKAHCTSWSASRMPELTTPGPRPQKT